MLNRINFLFLDLYRYRSKHLSIFIIATLLISLLSATLFISTSIQKDLQATLKTAADFTLQKFRAGHMEDMPESRVEEFLNIEGVSDARGRVYGYYYYEPLEHHFMIVGIDLYDPKVQASLQKMIQGIDIEAFLKRKNMLIGSGVKQFFDKYSYDEYYIFRPPDRSKEKVYIYGTLPQSSDIVSSDLIFMSKDLARTILGIQEGYVSDIVVNVANKEELEKVKEKLIISHFDMRVIDKRAVTAYYEALFDYKSGLFLALFLIALCTFLLILYQRYTMVLSFEAKEIALLRLVGYSLSDVIYLKLIENFIVAMSAFMLGNILAFIYVYLLDAPLLRDIFLGYKNLEISASFSYYPDFATLSQLFFLFVVPFILSILIPVYRVCVADISEKLQ